MAARRRVVLPRKTIYNVKRRKSSEKPCSVSVAVRASFLLIVVLYACSHVFAASVLRRSEQLQAASTLDNDASLLPQNPGKRIEVVPEAQQGEVPSSSGEHSKADSDTNRKQEESDENVSNAEENASKVLDHQDVESSPDREHSFLSQIADAERLDFKANLESLETWLQQKGADLIRRPITAYLEAPMKDTVPGTGSRGNPEDKKDNGTPPQFITPLPLRTQSPNDLDKVVYTKVQTCHDMPAKFPIDRGLEFDKEGKHVVWNVGNEPTPDNFPELEKPFCPVEADPFLPWIHDVFPSPDGKVVHFVAQNRRRCRTGSKFSENVNRLVPQVALLQDISVERIDERRAQELAPNLWREEGVSSVDDEPRYRLAPHNESAADGQHTRFICRFSTLVVQNDDTVQQQVIGETLSKYPFSYDMAAYRKGLGGQLLTPRGKDSRFFWTSNLRFDCPVPEQGAWSSRIANGQTLLSDATPILYVDVIPIRTSVRYGEHYLTTDMIGPENKWGAPGINPVRAWGLKNVVPKVAASGRWTNIPVCEPPKLTTNSFNVVETKLVPDVSDRKEKPHFLSACLWASAEYKTRGREKGADTETTKRLEEWLDFHFMVGFDHVYLYDNSGAHTNRTSLEPILAKFPGRVTRYDWPSIVCNNNIPAHDSTGERSSQYAAENSCRTRHAPFTEWIASFDTDEYLVPMGNYTSLKGVLRDVSKQKTNILSFRSSRGYLRKQFSNGVDDGRALAKSENATFLEAYNCDSAGSPKPSWAERARKQVYRADYVPYHYVHYSTVTNGMLEEYHENPQNWQARKGDHPPTARVTDEIHEAVMIHAKSLHADMTARYKSHCRADFKQKWKGCFVAFPFPKNATKETTQDSDGFEYNCYENERVDNFWVPKLKEAMKERSQRHATL